MFYKDKFLEWFRGRKIKESTCIHYIRDTEKMEIEYSADLEAEFKKDSCQSLREKIEVTPIRYDDSRKTRYHLIIRHYSDFRKSNFFDPNEDIPMLDDIPMEIKYNIANIIEEGSFLPKEELENALNRLETKKNLILQGPPGTGKTWFAKRLAYALIGRKDSDYLRSMQFHATLSYEDFVRGWRPVGDGKLDLCDGPFLELIYTAEDDPDNNYVMVIEEINRGNPVQIFGELLTLLEADKRHPDEVLQLCHQKDGKCISIHIPHNVHVIGTMNIADRSLALVDFALRRRFAFITLEPHFGDKWLNWMTDKAKLNPSFAQKIAQKMLTLNKHISEDVSLGSQYAIGHSYVTCDEAINNPHQWFRNIANTEIEPLLREYWFDAHDRVKELMEEFKEGI